MRAEGVLGLLAGCRHVPEFRTMFVQFDFISGRPRLRYETNFVVGEPPSHIPEISPLLKSRIINGNWGNAML